MKSSWTLLVAVFVSFSGLLLLQPVASEEPQQNTDGGVGAEDRDDDDDFTEFEDKMIRTWIEHFVDRYNKGVQQSSTKSAHIQRIAKKNRSSTSTPAIPALSHRHARPFLPVLFNPYYPTGYSNFVPLPQGPTTHLIPISQQEYYQRFLAPFSVHFPYAYTHVPMPPVSSTPIINSNNNPLKVKKKPVNVQILYNGPPPHDQDETRILPGETKPPAIDAVVKDLLNQNPYDFDRPPSQVAIGEQHRPDEIEDKIENGENEDPNVPLRDGKLLDNDQTKHQPTASRPVQMTEPQQVQHSEPQSLDTSTRPGAIVYPGETQRTPTTAGGSTQPGILSGLDSLFPLEGNDNQDYYRSSDGPIATTREPDSEESETAEPSTTTTVEERNQQGEARDAETQPPPQTVNETTSTTTVQPTTAALREQSVPVKPPFDHVSSEPTSQLNQTREVSSVPVATTEASTETARKETTPRPESLVTGYPMTAVPMSTACANNDCGTSKSSGFTSPPPPSVQTTEVLVNSPTVAAKTTVESTTPTTTTSTAIDDHENRLNSVSASTTTARLTSTTILETTTTTPSLPTTTPREASVPVTLKSTDTPLHERSGGIESSGHVASTPRPQQLPNDNDSTTTSTRLSSTTEKSIISQREISVPVESTGVSTPRPQQTPNDSSSTTTRPETTTKIIEQTVSPLTSTDGNSVYTNNTKRSATIDDKSTTTTTTMSTTVSSLPKEQIAQTKQDEPDLSYVGNKSSRSRQSAFQTLTTTVRSNTSKDQEDKINSFVPTVIAAKETTVRSPLKPSTMAQTKPKIPVRKQSTVITDGTKYRKSVPNQDRYTTETAEPSQATKDSDLWYSHVNTQSPHKKELNEQEINYLLKKLIKLLKPEIEKESITNDSSITRFLAPNLGDREKLIYVIFPFIRDEAKNMINEERTENDKTGLLENSNKK